MSRQTPGIKKIELSTRTNGKPDVRYIVTVDVGTTEHRDQKQRRFKTEAAAKKWQTDTRAAVRNGTYVATSRTTVEQVCADWLASRHKVKPSTLRGYKIELAPLRETLGHVELQKLTKNQLDDLVKRLRAGNVPKHHVWKARSVNGLLTRLTAILDDQMKQGNLVRNVAALVDRIPSDKPEMKTLSKADMWKVLDFNDRDRHLWWLALVLCLRRGEIAGLRRKFVDLEKRTVEIVETRICVGKDIITETPKSANSHRILPIPEELVPILEDAFGRIESEWVACGPDGEPYHPNYVTERWYQMQKAAGIKNPVRLHDGRHTGGSYLSDQGVGIAKVSKYMGHSTVRITAETYLHNMDDEFKEVTNVFGRKHE